ncbi:MAG: hypothetical protein KatS3mg105_4739 [Gemmatales bacterium]|nr:MAG: hypothetical protein KatS3mg105_4739 [Gemmatales bacterium]
MEHHPDLLTDPRSLRQSYLDEIQSFIRQVKRGCLQHNIDYVQLSTDKNLGIVLSSYLSRRLSRRAR